MIFLSAILAAVLVVFLAVYALRLWRQVWRQASENSSRDTQLRSDARADQITSARMLAKSLLNDELNLTEAAIRLKVMLDHLFPDGSGEHRYPAFYAMYDASEYLARGPARRSLPFEEKLRQDGEREALEREHAEAVSAEAKRLLSDEALLDGSS